MLAVARQLLSRIPITLVASLAAVSVCLLLQLYPFDPSAFTTAGNALALPATADTLTKASINSHSEARTKPTESATRAENNTIIRVGDRLSLGFFEKLALDDEEKWAARFQGRRPAINFHQRTELTGVYEVQDNGLIVLPLLGAFKADGRTVADLEADIIPIFQSLIGRFAFMSATIEQKPVYLLGSFVKPGVYKYTPGMTVWHLMALAGGIDSRAINFDRMINAVDQTERIKKSADLLKRALAKSAVLISERDDNPVKIPEMLSELTNEAEAKALIDAEIAARKPRLEARREQEAALSEAETSVRAELEQADIRLGHVKESIKLREQRVGDLKTLDKGISRTFMIQASTELTDARERLAEAEIAIKQTESKLAQIAKERAKLRSDHRIEIAREILDLNAQITELSITLQTTKRTTGMLFNAVKSGVGNSDEDYQYEIVRRTNSGQQILNVAGTEEILPGDLVRVKARRSISMLGDPTGIPADDEERSLPAKE